MKLPWMVRQRWKCALVLLPLLVACSDKPSERQAATSTSAAPPAVAPAPTTPPPKPAPVTPARIGPADLYLGMPLSEVQGVKFDAYKENDPIDANTATIEEYKKGGDICYLKTRSKLMHCDEAKQKVETKQYLADEFVSLEEGLKLDQEVVAERNVLGENIPIVLTSSGGKITKIKITRQNGTSEMVKQYLTALSNSYQMVRPSENELRDFDSLQNLCVAWMDHSHQVRLEVTHSIGMEVTISYAAPEQNMKYVPSCGPRSELVSPSNSKL